MWKLTSILLLVLIAAKYIVVAAINLTVLALMALVSLILIRRLIDKGH